MPAYLRKTGLRGRTGCWVLPLLLALVPLNPSFAIHPLITDDAEPLGKGNWQLEVNGEYNHDDEDGVKKETVEPAATLTYGLFENVDLAVGFPYQSIKTETAGTRSTEQEMSDVALNFKWRFYGREELALAVKPGMTLPTGDEKKGLGTGKVTYSGYFIGTKECDPWRIDANLGYVRNENKINERKDLWHASFAVEYEISEALELVGNIGVETNKDKASDIPPAFLLGGIVYSLLKNFDIDFGVKYGLTKTETDWTFLGGVTLRF